MTTSTKVGPPSQTEVERLIRAVGDDRRDAAAAVHLAQAGFAELGDVQLVAGRRHHAFFRDVAPERFLGTRNISLASRVLDQLIAEADSS